MKIEENLQDDITENPNSHLKINYYYLNDKTNIVWIYGLMTNVRINPI